MKRAARRRKRPSRTSRPDIRIELVLYVSGSSPASVRAIANLRKLLRRYRSQAVDVTICDLMEHPDTAERDQIVFTPTVCKRSPEPPMWILGDLTNPEPLEQLLAFYGAA